MKNKAKSMEYSIVVDQTKVTFKSLKELMAKASPDRSGDHLTGIAANNKKERVIAQMALADVPLKNFLTDHLVPYNEDEVTRLIIDEHDAEAFKPISGMSVGEFREWLLSYETNAKTLSDVAPGITPEMAAAVSKIMSNKDLMLVASKCNIVTSFRNTIGLPGRISSRLQPNHPTDDPAGIRASIVDGLGYGAGDAVIGINPATDSVDSTYQLLSILDNIITQGEIPTQSCVLSHITTQIKAMERGAPLDLVFQSIAGTQMTNESFGVNLELLAESRDAALSLNRGTLGNNVMYFETGQGSCESAGGHHGLDQQTLEARAYAVARKFSPLLVNTVVGFIGPEYLRNDKQIARAGLEDVFCGKLLGLPMGCDVCYTNHADADQNGADSLMVQLGTAGCNFFMSVPGAADVMLGYQSTSPHDMATLRQILDLKPSPEFEDWLMKEGIFSPDGTLAANQNQTKLLDTVFSQSTAEKKAGKKIITPASMDEIKTYTDAYIVNGHSGGSQKTNSYLKFLLAHAAAQDAVDEDFNFYALRKSIKAEFRNEVLIIETQANTKEEYKLRPDLGRKLSEESRSELQCYNEEGYDLSIILSDGLSAPATHKQIIPLLREFLPLAKKNGWKLAPIIIAPYARVALQDEIGEILNAKSALILLGERPGLDAEDSLGAYMTYEPRTGNTDANKNCVSNIREKGLSHKNAAETLNYLIKKSRDIGYSGVNLKDNRPSSPEDLPTAQSKLKIEPKI